MPTVTQGIIDFALAPPLGTLNIHLDGNGPYAAGSHTLTTWDDAGTTRNVSDTFGVVVQFNGTIPPYLGLTIGYSDGVAVSADEFENRIVQVVAQHQLSGGAWIISQLADVNVIPWTIRWAEALPGRLGLYVAPAIAVDLFFLRVL